MPTPRLRRFISRISVRLMAFNLLLVFLPVAGILYLGSYEQRLLGQQRRALEEEARLLAAAVASAQVPGRSAQEIMLERHRLRGDANDPIRLRVISPLGHIVADSRILTGAPPPQRPSRAKHNILYRIGAALLRPFLGSARTPEQPLAEGDYYERSERLLGAEVRSALQGEPGAVERISPDRRSVTVYVAEPIRVGDEVIGASLASQSTYPILQDLYTVRLGILRIFIISVIVA
ncbi:MAG TPA: sensor N-terminal transmembrane domain-containing protein, partial [Thermoanaerobaculia bacterium]|nr:sensor N-terminal transmembrane domain-containing protein [Thermoanaerobaculia bacterium]